MPRKAGLFNGIMARCRLQGGRQRALGICNRYPHTMHRLQNFNANRPDIQI